MDETCRIKSKGTCNDMNVTLAIGPTNSTSGCGTKHSQSSGDATGLQRKMRGIVREDDKEKATS